VNQLDQPLRLKNNGQINIVLNGEQKKIKVAGNRINTYENEPTNHNHLALQKIEEEMNQLVGMEEIKKIVKEIYAWIHINRMRKDQGLKEGNQVLHMLFKGNPGTGKTTVAKLLGKLFREMEVLSKGHLIEAERADLVGEYIGHTAQKTRDLVKKAIGGILFIDEAYSLARGGEKDFGKEAIDTLVNHMEQYKDDFVLILAGYSKEMENFLSLNPGLDSRFPIKVHFKNYTSEELMEIAKMMMKERQYEFTKEAERKLNDHLRMIQYSARSETFSNGRYIRNLIEKAVRKQAMRLLYLQHCSRQDLMLIRGDDLILNNEKTRE
jgi:stage V sporulation protein K